MTRAELHRLVDDLPDESVDAAGVLLMRARDPMVAALEAAPFNDEPYTEDDRAASDEGWAAYQRGEAIKVGELRAEGEHGAVAEAHLTASGASSRCRWRACSPSLTAISERAALARRR